MTCLRDQSPRLCISPGTQCSAPSTQHPAGSVNPCRGGDLPSPPGLSVEPGLRHHRTRTPSPRARRPGCLLSVRLHTSRPSEQRTVGAGEPPPLHRVGDGEVPGEAIVAGGTWLGVASVLGATLFSCVTPDCSPDLSGHHPTGLLGGSG